LLDAVYPADYNARSLPQFGNGVLYIAIVDRLARLAQLLE
jgi:hypothetical protein